MTLTHRKVVVGVVVIKRLFDLLFLLIDSRVKLRSLTGFEVGNLEEQSDWVAMQPIYKCVCLPLKLLLILINGRVAWESSIVLHSF